ncbi:MAG: gamma carbonic anhydrase family protein [Bacteroidetes bacterium]|nr:gamma carbonic anhydrase family protein [Bacteroidota bacterium]
MSNYQQNLEAKVIQHERIFIADTARVLGNVELHDDVSIWFGAVLRADFDKITIGKRTNIQENAILHVDFGKPVEIGEDNIIGHGAIVHGAKIGNHNLIGMRATILNGAKIGNGCVIGAHALITENMEVPDGSMVLGSPGKIVKTLPIEHVKNGVLFGVKEYLSEKNKFLGLE